MVTLMNLLKAKDDKLAGYVRSELTRGTAEENIRRNLLSAGWPQNVIDQAFSSIKIDDPSGSSVLSIQNVSKSFGDKEVLKGVNIDIKKGEIFGIIGLSGSGKTTLLNTIIGCIKPEHGDVFFRNPESGMLSSVYKDQKRITRTFGFAPQDPSFYARLTCEENLDHFGSLYNMPSKVRKTNIDSLLYLVELDSARKTLGKNLSGGMQRRLGIACSLIHDPKVLILDEPTADLDPIMRREVWGLIRKINKQGTSVVITSHFLSEMEGLCHRIAILHNKSIVDYGSPDELKDRFSSNHEIHLELATDDYSKVISAIQKKEPTVKKVVKEEGKIILYTPHSERVLHSLLHVIEQQKQTLLDIEVNKASLREVFESYVSK